jgi:hypothetical protein
MSSLGDVKSLQFRGRVPVEMDDIARQRHVHGGHPFGDGLRMAGAADHGLQVRQGMDLGGEGDGREIFGVRKDRIGQ